MRLLSPCSLILSLSLAACGGPAGTPAGDAGKSGDAAKTGDAAPTNVIIKVVGEEGSGTLPGCMLHWTVENRQDRDLNVVIELAARSVGAAAELSSSTLTVATRAPAGGTGKYPGYSLSGAKCADLEFGVTQFQCFGGADCVADYRSEKVAGLIPPKD